MSRQTFTLKECIKMSGLILDLLSWLQEKTGWYDYYYKIKKYKIKK